LEALGGGKKKKWSVKKGPVQRIQQGYSETNRTRKKDGVNDQGAEGAVEGCYQAGYHGNVGRKGGEVRKQGGKAVERAVPSSDYSVFMFGERPGLKNPALPKKKQRTRFFFCAVRVTRTLLEGGPRPMRFCEIEEKKGS